MPATSTGAAGSPGVRLGRAVRDPSAKALLAVVAGAQAPPATGDGAQTGPSAERDGSTTALLRAAAEGLAGRDRTLWELSAGSTLTGAELAAAVDVPPGQIYTVLNRMRRRAWRALAAVLLVDSGAGHCPVLAAVLDGCEDGFSPLVRKRVARHLDRCGRCRSEVADRLDRLVAR